MRFADVETVLDSLEAAGVAFWVAGGWGVAALVGVQTREHRDLDLAVDALDLSDCLQTLEAMGYRRETDWLPVRIEYAAPGERWVDVHPVSFDEQGHGRQVDHDGGHFDYPPDGFTRGRLDGRVIPCLSAGQQKLFHSGYEPRSHDLHDLDQLRGL